MYFSRYPIIHYYLLMYSSDSYTPHIATKKPARAYKINQNDVHCASQEIFYLLESYFPSFILKKIIKNSFHLHQLEFKRKNTFFDLPKTLAICKIVNLMVFLFIIFLFLKQKRSDYKKTFTQVHRIFNNNNWISAIHWFQLFHTHRLLFRTFHWQVCIAENFEEMVFLVGGRRKKNP